MINILQLVIVDVINTKVRTNIQVLEKNETWKCLKSFYYFRQQEEEPSKPEKRLFKKGKF